MPVDDKRAQLLSAGWKLEERKDASGWRIIGQNGVRVLYALANGRDEAWETLFSAIQDAEKV